MAKTSKTYRFIHAADPQHWLLPENPLAGLHAEVQGILRNKEQQKIDAAVQKGKEARARLRALLDRDEV